MSKDIYGTKMHTVHFSLPASLSLVLIRCELRDITVASWFPRSDPINTLSQYFVDSIIGLNAT